MSGLKKLINKDNFENNVKFLLQPLQESLDVFTDFHIRVKGNFKRPTKINIVQANCASHNAIQLSKAQICKQNIQP